MRLYYLRHGLAEDREVWTGADSERPLTKTGRERLEASVPLLSRLNLGLDIILTSPLKRAYQTAEIVATGLDLADRLLVDQRLAGDLGVETLAEILSDYPRAQTLMLVGHEPYFSESIQALTGGRVVCKKGSLARVDLDANGPLQGELVWLIPPKAMG